MHDMALRARQDLGTSDKVAHMTEAFCHDRDFSVATDLSSSQKKKKKKMPKIWGITIIICIFVP